MEGQINKEYNADMFRGNGEGYEIGGGDWNAPIGGAGELNIPDTPLPERQESGIEGVEVKHFFAPDEQLRLMDRINEWFEVNKEQLMGRGITINVARTTPEGLPLDSLKNSSALATLPEGMDLPPEVIELFDAVMHDSARNTLLGQRTIKLALRRTGDDFTHPDNLQFHLDTSKYNIAEDGTLTRDPQRSVGKYMAFVGRPGTQVLHGRIDSALTQQEGTALAPAPEAVDIDEHTVSQLLPNQVYFVETGNVLHNAPSHEDGLLFEVSFDE